LIRVYYHRFVGIVLVAGVAWLVFRLINRWGERARLKALTGSGYRNGSIVLLGQRVLNVLVIVVAVLVSLSILGFDISTVVAGLGIGSIAIAFAAQKTLENLFGGMSILGDQVIRVGDFCRIGDYEGTVEDISLRSTRLRTPSRTELSVPNGQLANMNVENLSRRDKRLFETTIHLRQDTSPEQLRSLIAEMRTLLDRHPKVDPNVARVRLVGFGDDSVDVELHCLILTTALDEYFAIREELLLRIMNLIADTGTGFAIPGRAIHLPADQDINHQRTTSAGETTILRHGT
jgi:MscS family membrane protein